MKTKIFTSLLTIMLLTLFSCKDFLDIKPKGQIIPSSTDDYRQILDYVGNKNSVSFRIDVMKSYGITDYLSDDYQVVDSAGYEGLPDDRYNRYTWAKEAGYLVPPENEDLDWRTLYGQIYIMNSAIGGIPDATGPEDVRNALMGEAKVHRAFCYLALVNIYAKHYNPATAATDMGVPLHLNVSLTASLARATVQEVYDQILKDLSEAAQHLPATQPYNFRPTSASAYALLARTYLYQGNYAKVLENANMCLSINNFLYDLNLDPFEDDFKSWDDREILLQKERPSGSAGNTYYYYYYQTSDSLNVEGTFDVNNDLRYSLKFNGYTYNENPRRWKGETAYYECVGVTVPEVYLMRAEANARLNSTAEAIADLNKLRMNRFAPENYIDYTNSYSQAEVIQLVMDERRRELWGRGLRWFDLKRYNAIENANITITRNFSGDQLAPGDAHWVMPIGGKYIGLNPEIEQNEGYN